MDMQRLYQHARTRWPHPGPITVLHVGDSLSGVASGHSAQAEVVWTFALGIGQLVTEVLTCTPPTPLQIEVAIERVEEQVMPAYRALPPGSALVSQDACLWQWAHAMDWRADVDPHLSLDALENLFNAWVAYAQGRPAAVAGVSFDARCGAVLVILRELMHHLHFSGLTLLTPTESIAT